MELSIVIPVYNSETILPVLVKEIQQQMSFLDRYEIILVNDCSPDNSWNIIKNLSKEYGFVKGINLRKNTGQHNAIMAGLHYAKGEVIVMMDDDLQHSPIYIKELFYKIIEGYDVCYTKYLNRQHDSWKVLGSKFNDMVANILLSKPKGLYLSSFKAIHKSIIDEIIEYDGPYAYIDGLILMVTNNITNIEIEHKKRYEGKSNYNLISLVTLWTKMATSFSVIPLRIATFLGIIMSIISFFLGIFFIIEKLMGVYLPNGWTSLMVMILFLGGIQLLSIGIIGEYVGRSYLKLNKKKQFVIKEIIK